MPFLRVPQRYLLNVGVPAGVVLVVLLAGPLLLPDVPAATTRKATPLELVLAWSDRGDQLRVAAEGYRRDGVVEVRLGSDLIEQTRADKMGEIHVSVPHQLIVAGQPGASIAVVGRSKIGTSRVFVGAVPPRAGGRGPMTVLPWAIAAGALIRLGFAMLRWSRRIRRRRHGQAELAESPNHAQADHCAP